MSYKSIIHGCCLVSQKPSNISKELIVKYISDGNTPILLYNYYKEEEGEEEWWKTADLLFDKVEIDGVKVSIADLDNAQGMLLLSEGEHTVKYTLKDPTSIGDGAFVNCGSLTSVIIPNSVTNVGVSAFEGCINLTSVIFGNNITNIGDYAFCECLNLPSVTIPNSVTSIRDAAFTACTNLTNVTLSNKINEIDSGVFSGCNFTSIGPVGSDASIEIPNSVTRINLYAFSGCNNLTSIIIPDSVTYIDYNAFDNGGRVGTRIIIGSGITNISENHGLTPDLVVIHSTIPPSDDFPFDLVLDGNDILTVIQVPATAVDTYKAAWPNCADIIGAYIPDNINR